mmetsp:Transcript_11020/g.37427  ORF Transcript_11020/g.37427 Transcript_11020/m.37427 type:complete len:189 (-) Transcript_11020:133-699(-)
MIMTRGREQSIHRVLFEAVIGDGSHQQVPDSQPAHALGSVPPTPPPAPLLVGRDVKPFVGLHVVRSKDRKQGGDREGVGTIERVLAGGKQCLVGWKSRCSHQDKTDKNDHLVLCNTGKDKEYSLAKWIPPRRPSIASRWLSDALLSPRYKFDEHVQLFRVAVPRKQSRQQQSPLIVWQTTRGCAKGSS